MWNLPAARGVRSVPWTVGRGGIDKRPRVPSTFFCTEPGRDVHRPRDWGLGGRGARWEGSTEGEGQLQPRSTPQRAAPSVADLPYQSQ